MGYKSRLFNDEVYMSGCHLQIFPLDDEGTGQANQHPWHRRPTTMQAIFKCHAWKSKCHMGVIFLF